jgi:hypothetical protein
MIRFFRALVWLRWRMLVHGLTGGRRRDAVESLSRIVAAIAPMVLFVFWVGSVVAAAGLGLIGGFTVGRGALSAAGVLIAVRLILVIVVLLMLVLPVAAASQGSLPGHAYERLLLLPIPRRALHVVDLLATLADPWIAFVPAGLVCFSVGLLLGGRFLSFVVAFTLAIALAVVLALLASVISYALTWTMRSRRRGELLTLVFVLALSLVGLLPTFAVRRVTDRAERNRQRAARVREGPPAIERLDRALPLWTRALPSEAYARSLRAGLEGPVGQVGTGFVILAAEGGLFYALSTSLHRRLLDSAESGGGRRHTAAREPRALRLPGLSRSGSAVALTQARTVLRSVRGRLSVLLTGPILAAMVLAFRRLPPEIPFSRLMSSEGHILLGFGTLMCLLSLHPFTMNQFGSDRAGLTLQFLSPLSDEELVFGKAAGGGIVLVLALLPCLVTALAVARSGSPFAWVAVLLIGLSTYVLVTPLAALISAVFPVAADLSKTGTGGNPHPLAMLAGMLTVPFLAGPPGLVLAVVGQRLDRPLIALLIVALWSLVAVLVARPLLRLSAQAVGARRENLALVAQGR